ncbi:MAG: thioredoxin family protein [Deltaproteobacteria bacterium]|nr:thioredoxin family protein [Deltaproteobacteria bacterium]
MAKTQSTMVELGSKVPDFFIPEVNVGDKVGPNDLIGAKAFVIMFISKHCPYVQNILEQITALTNEYLDKSIRFAAITSNDIEKYPDDHPDQVGKMAQELGWKFPVLFDADQSVARAFDAACTPDFFVYNKQAELVYRGQLDDSRPGNGRISDGKDLRAALDAILAGNKPTTDQHPSLGCNIKWK